MVNALAGESPPPSARAFEHEALFYAGVDDFVERVGTFIEDGIEAAEPALVVVDADKIDRLRARIGPAPAGVRFADMADVGRNPARIIPAWAEFVERHAGAGGRFRGVGEPIWPDRSADELAECERHEALLNLAFADSGPWTLVCPYDVTRLDPAVLREAGRNHPFVREGAIRRRSDSYVGLEEIARPHDRPLPEAPPNAERMTFDADSLAVVRTWASDVVDRAGVSDGPGDAVLAVGEATTNSVRHGGGEGTVLAWTTPTSLVLEVRDSGRIGDPLVGRSRPPRGGRAGFGMWIITQLCDLVQIRSDAGGSVVRLHFRRT